MIKKLATTLPNLVHTILAKLNKDDPRGEERGVPASSSASSSSKPIPSAKQAKNPFFLSRDYLDHTLEAISVKSGMTIPPHLYHALMNCLLTNTHLVIDSSFIENGATGFALFNMIPYLVDLRCAYVMCTSSTTPGEIFRKLVDPHAQSYSIGSADSDLELNASGAVPLSLSLTTNPVSTVPLTQSLPPQRTAPQASSSAMRIPNTTKHQRRQSRLRPNSENLSEETMQTALNPNITASQTSLPQHSPGKHGPIYAQVLVVDNFLTAPPNTLAALYQVMKSRQVPLKGYKYNTPTVFIVVAVTGKKHFPTISPSPFLMDIPFFDPLNATHSGDPPSLAITEGEILQARAALPTIYVAQDMHQYMRNIVMAMRNHSAVDVGPDTLALTAFENAARAAAIIAGQKFVTPTHILAIVAQVLNHRTSLIPHNPSTATNPLTFPSTPSPVHATSRFMAYMHVGRARINHPDYVKNRNSINIPKSSSATNISEQQSKNRNSPNTNSPNTTNNNNNNNTYSTSTTTTTTTTTTSTPAFTLSPPPPEKDSPGSDHNSNSNPNSPPGPNPLTKSSEPSVSFYIPNFPTPPSAEVFSDSFDLLEFLLNNLDIPV